VGRLRQKNHAEILQTFLQPKQAAKGPPPKAEDFKLSQLSDQISMTPVQDQEQGLAVNPAMTE